LAIATGSALFALSFCDSDESACTLAMNALSSRDVEDSPKRLTTQDSYKKSRLLSHREHHSIHQSKVRYLYFVQTHETPLGLVHTVGHGCCQILGNQ